MFEIPGLAAFNSVFKRPNRDHRYPPRSDPRFRNGGLFPYIAPRFTLTDSQSIFTMGSCFARNIEQKLAEHGLRVPVTNFHMPEGELPHAAPHMLNEYNAGTMSQRLGSALGLYNYDPDAGIEETPDGFIDLFLHLEGRPTSLERLRERRAEIDALYKEALASDSFILTLGLVESWYDKKYGCYLNRPPSYKLVKSAPDRFMFRCFDFTEVADSLGEVLTGLHQRGVSRILLTVSPVPLHVSFLPGDIVNNNCYAKSILRVSAERIVQAHDFVDYFPSYEIMQSYGAMAGFAEDNIHVRTEIVALIIDHMTKHYLPETRAHDEPDDRAVL